jgi:PAS domain S-box-containing protein
MDPNQDKPPIPSDGIQAAGAAALRIVLIYAVFAGLWILLSDEAVGLLFNDPAQLVQVSTLKGWLFVAVTSLLLFGFIRHRLDQARLASRREHEALAEKARALQLLDAIVGSSTDAIFAKDRDDRFLLYSRGAARVTGKRPEDVLGRDETAVFPPEIARQLIADNRRVMAENRVITFEDDIVTVEGPRTFLSTKGPLHDADGQVVGMFGIARDITERKHAEMELRRNIDELERFNRVAVDRELDMIRLKRQVNDLSRQLGQAPPYVLDFVETKDGERDGTASGAAGESS